MMLSIYKTRCYKDNKAVREITSSCFLAEYITKPIITPNKELTPMWGFYEGHAGRTENKEGKNWSAYTALLLDYDCGVTIEKIQQRLKPFYHYGYSSYNHRHGENDDRFRVVLPLSTPLAFASSTAPQSLMADFFRDIDQSSFNRGRLFCCPAVHPNRIDLYRHWRSRSNTPIDTTPQWIELMERVNERRKELEALTPTRPVSVSATNVADQKRTGAWAKMHKRKIEQAKEYVDNQLGHLDFARRGGGQGINQTLCSCHAWLYHHGITEEDRLELLGQYAFEERTIREIEAIVRGYHPEE